MIRFCAALILSFFWILPTHSSAQENPLKKEVSTTIETLLKALGEQDINTLEDLFTNDAVLIVARQRDGQFRNTVQTAKDWLQGMRQNPGAPFEERLANIEITVERRATRLLESRFRDRTRRKGGLARSQPVHVAPRRPPMEGGRDLLYEFPGRETVISI